MKRCDRTQYVAVCRCGCGQPTLLPRQTDAQKGWIRNQTPLKVIKGHPTWPGRAMLERFGGRYQVTESGCWQWTGAVGTQGYGTLNGPGRQRLLAHRVSYELNVGPIPDGLHVDHTCHNRDPFCPGGEACAHRLCVNPDHLEAVTQAENNRRARERGQL